MTDEVDEMSDGSRGSLPAALADYKQLAKDCGVDEGIDLPVVAMAFVHGAAYGAKQPTLTDAEREATRRRSLMQRTEIELLRDAIRRLAKQDATLSACNGSVTVTMDATLTDEERAAIEKAIGRELDAEWYGGPEPDRVVVLRGLLERLG